VKATLVTDKQKTVMVVVNENDKISELMKRISEKLSHHYELFRNINNLRVKDIVKRSNKLPLKPEDQVA